MKLILAVVQDEDSQILISNLMKNGFQTTKLASTGGFLRAGNTTLMIGVDLQKLNKVVDIIEKTCKSRKQIVNSMPVMSNPAAVVTPMPVEVTVGGATLFGLDIDQFIKI